MSDDLAGSAMLLPQVLVLGDWDRAEIVAVKAWVQSLGASACVRHQLGMKVSKTGSIDSNPTELVSVETGLCTTNRTRLVQKPEIHRDKLGGVGDILARVQHQHDGAEELDSASPDMVVVCQSWPDEFSASEVATHLGRWPLALWVCCFGSWCESDGRTRTIWPIGIRVPARAAIARLNRLWAIVTGRLQEPLPITASRDEAFEFDATLLTEPVSEAIDVSGAVIIVRSPDPALRVRLSDLGIALGATLANGNTAAFAENMILLWDVDPDWPQATTEIKDFIARNSGVRVIAVAGLPYPELVESLRSVGVEAVVTKTSATSQLAGIFAAKIDGIK